MSDSGKSGKIIKHSSIYMIGTLSRQLASFLMLPVYTHYLTPADYGVVGLLVLTLSLMEVFFGARLGDAIPKFYYDPKNESNRKAILSTALTITAGVSSVAALIIFLFRNPASSLLFGTDSFGLVVGLFGIQILTQAIEYYGFTFIRIQQRPWLSITISLTKLVLQLTLNIWFVAIQKEGVMGVVISGGISSTLYAVGLSAYILYKTGYKFDMQMAKSMLAFNFPLWFAGLASLYIFQSNRYLLRYFGSLDHVGIYELAAKFSFILPLLAWSPFAQIWEMERFNYYRQNNASELFGSVFRLISTALFVVALGISIFAAPVIRIMSAPSFHTAAISVPLLTLGVLFSCLTTFANFSLLISEKTPLISQNNYLAAIAVTVLNVALIPKMGELGAAIALMLALMIQFALVQKIGRRHYDMQIRIKPLATMTAVTVSGYIVANHIVNMENLWLDIAVKLVVYTACTAILAVLLWRDPSSRPHLRKLTEPLMRRFLQKN